MDLKSMADRIRNNVLDMTFRSGANGGHLGGAFSSAEILATLYGSVMNVDPADPENKNRDRFFLSKGHCAIGHYAVLKEAGFLTEDEMFTFELPGSAFPTHEVLNLQKGIEVSSGSLGYGLSIGVGSALNAKRRGYSYKVYVLMGDGECNEGTVWEAAQAASRFALSNLIAIVDVNGQSLDGYTSEIMPIRDMCKVWKGFGWNVLEVAGNDTDSLLSAFQSISAEKPNVIIAHTVKCKGLPTIEGKIGWHHVRLTKEQYESFKRELEEAV